MKLKRITAIVTALTLTLAASLNILAASFTDTVGHWAEETINTLADMGIVNGVTETEFLPDSRVTRAEFLKMAMNTSGIKTEPYRYGECLEVDSSDWYAPYLQSALDKGLIPENMIAGYTVEIVNSGSGTKAVYGGAFNGMLPITREEMAVLAQYTYQYTRNANTMKQMKDAKDMPFSDANDISGWAYETVKLAYSQGFIDGMDDGTFSPKSTATRAQAAVIIKRMMDIERGDNGVQ